jgi:fatty acid desaturase
LVIDSKNISKKSLFKLLLAGFGIGSLVLWLLFSIVSIFVGGSIDMSIESASGLAGFLETLVIWPFFALLWAAFTWLFLILGLAIVNRFTSLTIETKN